MHLDNPITININRRIAAGFRGHHQQAISLAHDL
jgi:hypothetical protein